MAAWCRVEGHLRHEVRMQVGNVGAGSLVVQLVRQSARESRRQNDGTSAPRSADVLLRILGRESPGDVIIRVPDEAELRSAGPSEANLVIGIDVLGKED